MKYEQLREYANSWLYWEREDMPHPKGENCIIKCEEDSLTKLLEKVWKEASKP